MALAKTNTKTTAKCTKIRPGAHITKRKLIADFNIVADMVNMSPPPSADPTVIERFVRQERELGVMIGKFYEMSRKATKFPNKYKNYQKVLSAEHARNSELLGACFTLRREAKAVAKAAKEAEVAVVANASEHEVKGIVLW